MDDLKDAGFCLISPCSVTPVYRIRIRGFFNCTTKFSYLLKIYKTATIGELRIGMDLDRA